MLWFNYPKCRRSCRVSSFYMLPRFCVFPDRKQQALLHLFSFLLEVGKHLVTNATWLWAETMSHPLLFAKGLANNHVSGEIHENWACNRFMENTAWSKIAPKLEISLLRKAACLFVIFWKFRLMKSDQNKNTFYIITFDGIHEKTFTKTSLVQWMNFGVIILVWTGF